jgi:hypothetical protein
MVEPCRLGLEALNSRPAGLTALGLHSRSTYRSSGANPDGDRESQREELQVFHRAQVLVLRVETARERFAFIAAAARGQGHCEASYPLSPAHVWETLNKRVF